MEKLKSKNSIFSTLQRVGQSFMFPTALLPVAGLLLGIGASFSNSQMIASYGLEWLLGKGTFLYFMLTVMKNTGDIVFTNLPIIFAIGVALGMAKTEKAVAALSAAISFFIMHTTIFSLLLLTGKFEPGAMLDGTLKMACGINSLDMGVFGGIIVGLGVAYLNNKFYKIKLPNAISFWSGIRFIPIISSFVFILIGILMFFIWPQVQVGMHWLGGLVTASKYAGTFAYGIIKRALIPFGLHHVFTAPFWYTNVGGTALIDGIYASGAQNIFFAQLASPNITRFSVDAARFLGGEFPVMMCGLPAAALAIYHAAKPNKKQIVGGLLLSASLACLLTGITEPIEFTFLFMAPVLYAVHCVLTGLAFMLLHLFNIAVGTTFSPGFIDFILFGVLQGNSKTSWIMLIPIGIVYAFIYYFVFKFAIKKFNLMTPGREEDELESKLFTKKDFNASKQDNISELILQGLGGVENITNLECCATRLRVTVADAEKIDEPILKQSGAAGVIKKGGGIQVVYGPRVTVIKSELEDYISDMKVAANPEIEEKSE